MGESSKVSDFVSLDLGLKTEMNNEKKSAFLLTLIQCKDLLFCLSHTLTQPSSINANFFFLTSIAQHSKVKMVGKKLHHQIKFRSLVGKKELCILNGENDIYASNSSPDEAENFNFTF